MVSPSDPICVLNFAAAFAWPWHWAQCIAVVAVSYLPNSPVRHILLGFFVCLALGGCFLFWHSYGIRVLFSPFLQWTCGVPGFTDFIVLRYILLLSPFFDEKTTEKFSNLPRVTQLVSCINTVQTPRQSDSEPASVLLFVLLKVVFLGDMWRHVFRSHHVGASYST